jgi:hypothetical protein
MFKKLLMDKADEHASASGYGSSSATTDTTKTETTGDSGAAATQSGAQDKGDQNAGESQQGQTQQQQKTQTELDAEKAKAASTNDQNNKDQNKEIPAQQNQQAAPDYSKVDLKGFKNDEIQDILDFAKENNLDPKTAQGLVDKRRMAIDDHAKNQSVLIEQRKQTYATWEKNLKEDPEFGGGSEKHFNESVALVNKFLETNIPSVSKELTTSGKRLSDNQMKEFRKLAIRLQEEGTHEGGSGSSQSSGNERKPWHSYTNNS